MKSIDNLREYVKDAPASSMGEMARAIVAGMADEIEREVADMVPLPVDADGVPIHVGETVTCMLPFGGESEPFVVDRMELGRDGDGDVWSVALDRPTSCWEQPLLLRHHHAPTVEDVLREFAYGLGVPVADSYVAATAAKLRLTEGSE